MRGHVAATRSGLNWRLKSAAGLLHGRAVDRLWQGDRSAAQLYQFMRLHTIYREAVDHVPYYRSRPFTYPKDRHVADVRTMLEQIPILLKHEVKQFNEDFWSPRLKWLSSSHTTSGTSGTPLRIRATVGERAFSQAMYMRWLQSLGARRSPRFLMLTGFMSPGPRSQQFAWRDYISKRLFLSIYSLDQSGWPGMRRLIEAFRPDVVHGYSSALHELAMLWARDTPRVPRPLVVSTSEMLLPGWRNTIIHAFGSCYELYGSQEGCHMATECCYGTIHINPYIGLLEIVDEFGNPTPPGRVGRVVVTGLVRRSMPLLRYELGDSAEPTSPDSVCACGSWWPGLKAVHGRSEDLIRTPRGGRAGMLGYSLLKDLVGVQQAQLLQRLDNSIVIRVEVGDSGGGRQTFNEGEVREKAIARLGRDAVIDFEYVRQIPRGPGGKVKAVIVESRGENA